MINPESFKDTLFERSSSHFNDLAIELFHYQFEQCEPYRRFVEGLKISPADVHDWKKIPHLPIEAFKKHQVMSGNFSPEVTYTSSGTTGAQTSRHFVRAKHWYERTFDEAFKLAYGPASQFKWLCLLPSYLERSGSSLIDMAENFIEQSNYPGSGFFLNNLDELKAEIALSKSENVPTILLGVSFALLDFADAIDEPLPPNVTVMETGGMKGRRKEMVRAELHEVLSKAFGKNQIHSEYGMTELLSQAYSSGNGLYETPPWMRVSLRDPADPLSSVPEGKTGGMNIIDLANVDSCAFIATQDLGRLHGETTFEVLGRFDDSDIRGCNLMVQ